MPRPGPDPQNRQDSRLPETGLWVGPLYPLGLIGAQLRAFFSAAPPGVPAAWTRGMTVFLVMILLALPVLHRWDGAIMLQATASEARLMEVLRALTQLVKAKIWLVVSVMFWLVTAWLLAPALRLKLRTRARDGIARLHDWFTVLILSILAGGIPVEAGKLAIGRARPTLFDSFGPAYRKPFAGEHVFESFPSGHSMMAGVLVVSLWYFAPRWRWLTLPVGLAFPISRLAVGAHYPTDVLAGFGIGIIATCWAVRFTSARGMIWAHSYRASAENR